MKYRYAIGENGIPTNIEDVVKAKKDIFRCIGCKKEMIAKKGDVREHHFAHKGKIACNGETYLHKLGVEMFYNSYLDCLDKEVPFYLAYPSKGNCTSCRNKLHLKLSCEINKRQMFDLTKKFDIVSMERKMFDGIFPDVLLSSSETDDVILIEIAVKHNCEEKKINKGHRIVEIQLFSENDLDFLRKEQIKVESYKGYNFKEKRLDKEYYWAGDCKMPVMVSKVDKQGKLYQSEGQLRQYFYEIISKRSEYTYYDVEKLHSFLTDRFNMSYFQKMDYIVSNGVKIKNCRYCTHCGYDESYFSRDYLYCKKKEEAIKNSNDASNCDFFIFDKMSG